MITNKFIVLLGFLVFLMPFLGFPHSYENIFYITAGLLILALSLLNLWQRRLLRKLTHHAKHVDTFTENTNEQSQETQS